MSTFNRGLDDEFVRALNGVYEKKGGWLRGLVDDKEVFLAIRENYVNFYYRGCSLLRLDWEGGAMTGKVHYKYLLRPNLTNPYVPVVDGSPGLKDDARSYFLHSLVDVDSLKKAVRAYAGEEKTGVHKILTANENILDVEVAFGSGGTGEPGASAPRVDFAVIREAGEGAKIVFYEAKRFGDRQALRAGRGKNPKVVGQMETYSRKLVESREAVRESYIKVCRNLSCLHGVAERHPERHALIEKIAGGRCSLSIDTNPVLVVFGFDGDQKSGKIWQPHREKLENRLKGRVQFRRDSEKFVLGTYE